MRSSAATATVLAIALALAGCGSGGSKSSTGTGAASRNGTVGGASPVALTPEHRAALAFSSHAGVAFGTFYRFIYAPYKAGAFNPPRPSRPALAKARSAAVVVAREIEAATRATRTSAALAKLRTPMMVLDEGFKAALARLKRGRFKLAEIEAANVAISAIKGSATTAGLSIGESSSDAL